MTLKMCNKVHSFPKFLSRVNEWKFQDPWSNLSLACTILGLVSQWPSPVCPLYSHGSAVHTTQPLSFSGMCLLSILRASQALLSSSSLLSWLLRLVVFWEDFPGGLCHGYSQWIAILPLLRYILHSKVTLCFML